MGILNRLGDLSRHFDAQTLGRGAVYASIGAVSDTEVGALGVDYVTVTASVRGSGGMVYEIDLEADEVDDDEVEIHTSCTCPVHEQCKHGAALAIVLTHSFPPAESASARQDVSPPAKAKAPAWRTDAERLLDELKALAPPQGGDLPGVALQFTLTKVSLYGNALPQSRLHLRPLRPGARQAWVKTGLGWSDVALALLRRSYDVAQLRVLAQINTELENNRTSYYYYQREPLIEEIGPGAVDLLIAARDAGVVFVGAKPITSIELVADPLALTADVGSHDGAARIRVGLEHDGRLWSGDDVTPFGDPAHTVLMTDQGRIVLAGLRPRLDHGPVRALRRTAPVVLPAEAIDDIPDLLRQLTAVLPVASGDGSVEIPDRLLPSLRVHVAWASADAAEVRWMWVYGQQTFALDGPATPAVIRDRAAEKALLARIEPPPELGVEQVTGVDALHLGLLQLPVWRAIDDIEVLESQAPDFREAEEGPEISFGVSEESDDAGGTDWLDLSVHITIEGEPVALAEVLEALTRGYEHLLLPSGLFVRTDRPEFAQLDDLVRAAEQLHDRADGRVRVGRHDLGLWAQLADLGVVDAQAAEWVRRAQALRDLVELPRPEPHGVVSTLRPYQLDGFHWLAFLWQHGLGGILADDMGLGKTLQVLTLVAHARHSQPDGAPFLVVAPTSVVPAWVTEAARHTPGLRVRAITASAARRTTSLAELAADADIVVTTYTLLRLEADAYAELEWGALVLDEAQQIKNHQSKAYAAVRRIDAPFRVAVTGTPFENRLLELWSLLSVVAPGLYPHPQQFVKHVVGPVEKGGDVDALRRFTNRIRPFVLRRTKELVAADLPPKQEQVLEIELAPRHRKLYDTHLAKERQRILGLVDDFDRNRVAILAALTTLRQLALDPALVDPAHDTVGSAKIDQLVEHLREVRDEGHRALVFSSFTGFLGRVRERLAQESISAVYLDGSTTRRGEVIERFRSGDASAFLISLKAGGVGLTLTEADYVFVLDPWWNPAAEAQAVDRAHRIGQQRTVMVYRMVSANTIEEKVMALKARKAALFAQVIDGEAGLSGTVTAADIRALFD